MRHRERTPLLGICVVLAIFGTCGAAAAGAADSYPALGFLLYNNSPRAAGLGGCAVNLVSSESPLANPAGLGVFHLDHVASVHLPSSTKWLPEVADDLRLKSWGVSAGVSYGLLSRDDSRPFDIAVGLAYSRLVIDYGKFVLTGEGGPEPMAIIEPYERTNRYSAGVGIEIARVVRIGGGFTLQKIKSVLSPSGAGTEQGRGSVTSTGHDYGLLAQARLHELWPRRQGTEQTGKQIHLELTPSYAFVHANDGDSVAYFDAPQRDPMPKITRQGPAVFASIDVNKARLISVFWTQEKQHLETGSGYSVTSHGVEFGVGDFFFYRSGKDYQLRDYGVKTQGVGFSLQGLVTWMEVLGKLDTGTSAAGQWLRRVDIRYDYAKLTDDGVLDGTTYTKLTIEMSL